MTAIFDSIFVFLLRMLFLEVERIILLRGLCFSHCLKDVSHLSDFKLNFLQIIIINEKKSRYLPSFYFFKCRMWFSKIFWFWHLCSTMNQIFPFNQINESLKIKIQLITLQTLISSIKARKTALFHSMFSLGIHSL